MKKRIKVVSITAILLLLLMSSITLFINKNNSYKRIDLVDYITENNQFEIEGIPWGAPVETGEAILGSLDKTKPRYVADLAEKLFPLKQFAFKGIDYKSDVCMYTFNNTRGFRQLSIDQYASSAEEASKITESTYEYLSKHLPENLASTETKNDTSPLDDNFSVHWYGANSKYYLSLYRLVSNDKFLIILEIGQSYYEK